MMGAQLVARVFAHWTHLPDRPFRLLTFMAHITKDTNAAPTFYGGRERMAEALGIPPEGASAERMVSRAVAVLVSEGAVNRVYLGHAGKRSEYLLTLDKYPPKGDSSVIRKGDSGVGVRVTPESGKGDSGVPAGVTVESPLGTTEDLGRKTLGASDQVTDVSGTRVHRPVRGKADESRLALVRKRADDEAAS
jgi:hypothetical protein